MTNFTVLTGPVLDRFQDFFAAFLAAFLPPFLLSFFAAFLTPFLGLLFGVLFENIVQMSRYFETAVQKSVAHFFGGGGECKSLS